MTKSVVVTGGASGMGAATVDRLQAQGCAVTVLDVKPCANAAPSYHYCDLSDPRSIDQALQLLPEQFDALVHVAGIAGPKPELAVMAVNFLAVRYLTEQCLSRITGGGNVTIVSSTAGRDWMKRQDVVRELLATTSFEEGIAWLEANPDSWMENPYKFSKQCASAWTYRACGEALARDVRVNCVNPGAVETGLTPAFRELLGNEMYDWGVAQIGRHAQPDDVAEVIEWLATGPCRWLNGVELVVDGGYIAGITDGWIDLEQSPSPPVS